MTNNACVHPPPPPHTHTYTPMYLQPQSKVTKITENSGGGKIAETAISLNVRRLLGKEDARTGLSLTDEIKNKAAFYPFHFCLFNIVFINKYIITGWNYT